MRSSVKVALSATVCAPLLLANRGGCTNNTTAQTSEQVLVNQSYSQILRNQPPPVFDWSLERRMLIEIYKARQRATNTFSVVQSDYTGKVLWSCPSLGFPLPYATQLTNPEQKVEGDGSGEFIAIPQPEQNGLFPPPTADATWVPCVDSTGHVTPVYEERRVTVFLQPMVERDGKLVPQDGFNPSFSISPEKP